MDEKVKLHVFLEKARGFVSIRYNSSYILNTDMFGSLVNDVKKNQAYSLFKNKYVSYFYVNNYNILTFEIED